jgi:hypothetical protein
VKALRWPLALLLAAGAVIAAPASMPAADLAQGWRPRRCNRTHI